MTEVSAQMVKELRGRTGASFIGCKQALEETEGDQEKAAELLRIKGLAKADKKIGRATPEGVISSYIHAGGKIGVMVEINCETDYVARTSEFQEFVKEVAMQIAASNPKYVSQKDITSAIIEKERELLKAEVIESGKPENLADKIVEGKIKKFYQDNCLLEQPYIREPKTKIEELLKSLITKVGENIVISRFARYQLGEGS